MATFGSVAWQKEMTEKIRAKVLSGQALDKFEQAFVDVQVERITRDIKATKVAESEGVK